MKYQTVIFDLDGTLLDTLQDLTNSVNYALRSMHYPERTLDEVRSFVGNGIAKLIEKAVPTDTSAENEETVFQVFKSHYADHCEENTAPYDGIPDLLKQLSDKGIRIAVVSNKVDFAVKKLCQKYFGDKILIAIGERPGVRRKPEPDSVFEALKVLNADPMTAVYVGDSEVDVATAANARIDLIAVTWGFRNRKILSDAGACVFADSVCQLKGILFES